MNKILILISIGIAGLLFYSLIQLINSRHAFIEQQIISEKQKELTAIQEAYIAQLEEKLAQKYSVPVTVTAYCDNDALTSIGEEPTLGTCAMPVDLLEIFPFGTDILLEGIGVYTVNNTSGSEAVDIWIGNCKDATAFGIKRNVRMTRILE